MRFGISPTICCWPRTWAALLLLAALSSIVPVGLEGQAAISAKFDGRLRLRNEGWSNYGFQNDQRDAFTLGRLLAGADVKLGQRFRAYVQARTSLISNRNLPGGTREIDADDFDLQNAFIDSRLPLGSSASLTARLGRQELQFGQQRLVSPLDWANTRRTFDGVRAIGRIGDVALHGFWTRPVRIRKTAFNRSDGQTDFFGVYASNARLGAVGVDLYWLALRRDSAAFNGTSGPERRHTVGARAHGRLGLEYDLEAAYQFGTVGSGRIGAYMLGAQLAYRLASVPTTPRVTVGLDVGSGDDGPGGDVGTFNQLFPLAHAYLGAADVVGRQNIVGLALGTSFQPLRPLAVSVTAHHFARASTADLLYNAGGAGVSPVRGGASARVGGELDVAVKCVVGHLTSIVGYSRFFAGSYLAVAGAPVDMHFWFASLELGI